jgi:hypothetical protein
MAWPFMRAAQLGVAAAAAGGNATAGGEEEQGGASSPSSPPSSSYLPHQWVSCVPGSFALTAKRAMVETLQEAYGELAFTGLPGSSAAPSPSSPSRSSPASRLAPSPAIAPITPRAYSLPSQYWAWRSYVHAAKLPPDTTWVLKREVHRGKGVSLLPQREAARRARPAAVAAEEGGEDKAASNDAAAETPVLIQSFLRDQLLVDGRRSYLRVWMAVTSVGPVRAYLFDGGFAIFSSSSSSSSAEGGGGKKQRGAAPPPSAARTKTKKADDGGVVNLWNQDRSQSLIWELKDLQAWVDRRGGGDGRGERKRRRRLAGAAPSSNGSRRWADAWRDMRAAAGLAAMAAAPYMRADAREGQAPPRGTFEYFGLDFVLDADLRPWLLEVNAVPSMARRRRSSGCLGGGGGGGSGSGGGESGGGSKKKAAAASVSSSSECALEGEGGDGFDAQKERFVHDVLAMIGMPLDGAGGGEGGSGKGGSDAASAAKQASSSSSGPPLSPEAAALRCAAADAHAIVEERRRSRRRRLGEEKEKEQQQPEDPPPPPPCDAAALAALDAAAAASTDSSAPPHARRIPRRDLLPLLCEDGVVAPQGGGEEGAQGWCARCLTPLDLAALADAEAEASRRGALVPVHDALAARRLNRAAVALKRASGYGRRRQAQAATDDSLLVSLARAALPAAVRDAPPPPAAGAPPAGLFARLRAWLLAWVLPESGAPQLLGARPRVDGAVRALELTREDYLLAAWQRTVREGPGGGGGGGGEEEGGGAHNNPRARLRRLARECFSA